MPGGREQLRPSGLLMPNVPVDAPDRSDILNVGGFVDAVFIAVAAFLTEDASRFVAEVEAIEL